MHIHIKYIQMSNIKKKSRKNYVSKTNIHKTNKQFQIIFLNTRNITRIFLKATSEQCLKSEGTNRN